MNLFFVFDPKASLNLPLNWLSSLVCLSMVQPSFWISSSALIHSFKAFQKIVFYELEKTFSKLSAPGLAILPLTLFISIASNNFLGLFPYTFTSSSHMAFTITFALPLWLGHMIMSMIKSPSLIFAHLVPLSTPPVLMPFMVVIELTSSLIRPLTLSVRLAANMVAGHLLLTLVSSQIPHLNLPMISIFMTSLFLLVILELAVSIIQAYVFAVLNALYLNEINSSQFFP